ncbi:hypothetical protein DPMN_089964 [Dreissena polymorpha]|uniref:Uncharacterized protein n=1 Tax=Dreissena polymorpha TaxID=45954 RepID=A0A9D4QZD3_DREPO|nr:hypothetical protein DPMN_089964 [Dreissena polymorpha]
MFGRHPRLAVDANLGLNTDDIDAKYKNEYARKLRELLASSYHKAKEIANRTAKVT